MKTKKKTDQVSTLIPAVAYARYSSSNQNEASIEQQLRDIRKWADDNGFAIIHEYKDAARSAFKEATESQRPEFRKMIDDSRSGSFQAVICWKTDRFSRNKTDSAIYMHELRKNGVRLFKVMESNIDGPESILIDGLMESMAQYYSENLSQNVKRGLEDNARKFKVFGKVPLGYIKDPETGKYAINEPEAELVRRIFREYASGIPAVQIYTRLNAEGYKTKEGKPFNKNSISKMVRNDRYIGVYTFKDVKTPGAIPAIIDQETFEKANQKRIVHHHSPKPKKESGFLLAGKVYCGECGSAMPGDSARSKSGKIHSWYTCYKKRFDHTCDNPRAKKADLEEKVVTALISFLDDNDMIENAADQILAYQEKMMNHSATAAIENNIREAEKKLDNIVAAIENGVAIQKLIDRAAVLEEEINAMKCELRKAKLETPTLTRDQILFLFREMFLTFDGSEYAMQRLVDTLLYKVFVYKDGKVVVFFNTSKNGDPEKITIDRIEQEISNEEECSNMSPLPQLTVRNSAHMSGNIYRMTSADLRFFSVFSPCSHLIL